MVSDNQKYCSLKVLGKIPRELSRHKTELKIGLGELKFQVKNLLMGKQEYFKGIKSGE